MNNANNSGWDYGPDPDGEWTSWGGSDEASAQTIAVADGYHQVLIKARAGYTGNPHDHEHAEFSYVLEGTVKHNDRILKDGEGYAAAAGSTHDSFEVLTDATYITIFKL